MMSKLCRLLVVGCGLAGALLVSACSMAPPLPRAPPAFAQAPDSFGDYVIGRSDILVVNFQFAPDFNQTLTVQPDGRIKLPMIGWVVANGQTPAGLAGELAQAYSPYLQRPDVSVIVQTANSQQAFVGGEVTKAGMVPLQPGMTVNGALFAAGGLKDSADTGHIVLLRRDVGGSEQAYRVDVASALDGSDLSQNIVLRPLDIVVVPKSGIANVNMYVQQYVRNNMPFGLGSGFAL